MLRLSPKRWYAGLFGQHAWLHHGARHEPLMKSTSLPSNENLPELLEVLLQTAPAKRRASKLSVVLPSHAARSVSLPWSPNLRGQEEMRAFALAHLEQAGLGVGDSHAVHAEYRHFGSRGFAYAVPQQLLEELHSVAARHEMELTTALPAVAVAHLATQHLRRTGTELCLVVEGVSISSLAFDCTGLRHYDAEPTIGGRCAALRRLLTRNAVDAAEFNGIMLCADHDGEELADIAAAFAVQGSVRRMKTSQWRRFL